MADADDRLDILELEARYARTWDTADAEAWAACFTDDGAFEMEQPGPAPETLRFAGRASLAEFCRRATARYEGIHLLSAPELDLAAGADAARAWVHFQYHDRDRRRGAVRHVVGVYAVWYRRTPEGWRMERRRERAVLSEGTFHGIPEADRMWDTRAEPEGPSR